jgi:hypothetical protein
MDLNRFLPDQSVLPHHCILLAPDFQNTSGLASVKVVYSGPLRRATEDLLQQAKVTLVHPGTLAAIKAKLDEMGAGTPIEEFEPSREGCPVGPNGTGGEHQWLPLYRMGVPPASRHICTWCDSSWEPPAACEHE